MMDENDRLVVQAMATYGGGFASAIAKAAMHADDDNYKRLKAAFPEIWKTYQEFVDIEKGKAERFIMTGKR